jgi:cytochrome P450
MAVMQMLLIVASFVRSYDFELENDTPVGIRPMMLLRPDGPIKMQFRPR